MKPLTRWHGARERVGMWFARVFVCSWAGHVWERQVPFEGAYRYCDRCSGVQVYESRMWRTVP